MGGRSWTRTLAAVGAAAVLAIGLAACGDDDDDSGDSGTGDAAAEVTLRLGYVTTAQHPYGQAVDAFVAQVEEESGGAISIETLPTYPGGDVPLLEDVRSGGVEMASVSTATWGSQGVSAFDALQAPFLITNYDLEREVLTSDIATDMLAATEEIGLVGLAIHEGGLRSPVGADKPIVSPGDWEGLKIRSVESDPLRLGLESLGAEPTPIPLPDVYNALRDGVVDGMEANLGLIQTQQYYEVADYATINVVLWPFPTALVINQSTYDSLSDEQQSILTDAATDVPGISLDIVSAPSDLAQTLCDEGFKFATATDDQISALEQEAQTAIDQLSEDEQTADYISRIQDLKNEQGGANPATPDLPDECFVK
jgi:TRAP-type C4-dicarboxylate transport system substrate-binding protein